MHVNLRDSISRLRSIGRSLGGSTDFDRIYWLLYWKDCLPFALYIDVKIDSFIPDSTSTDSWSETWTESTHHIGISGVITLSVARISQ
jgi:hypothetical protein